jgi:hypothetical protein
VRGRSSFLRERGWMGLGGGGVRVGGGKRSACVLESRFGGVVVCRRMQLLAVDGVAYSMMNQY